MLRFLSFSAVLFILLAVVAPAQQANSNQARLRVNNQEGPTYPYTADLYSPGVNVLEISGEPAAPFALFLGTLSPGWIDLGTIGKLDLHTGSSLQIMMDGFVPASGIDFYARLSPTDGSALVTTQLPAGLSGSAFALQAVVADPTAPMGVTLTGTAQMQFVTVQTSSSSAGMSTTLSGMAGTTGTLNAEIRAPIDAIGATSVTVMGNVVIEVATTSSLRDANGNSIGLAALQLGDFVKIETIIDPTQNQLRVHELRLESTFAGFDVKVSAAVDASTANSVTLLGVPFTAVAGSDINLTNGLMGLSAGDFVEVKADLVSGNYEIVEVHTTNPLLGIFEVFFKARAAVEAVSSNSVTVLGQEVFFGSGVRIEDFGSLTGVSVGDFVELRANPDQSLDLWATRLRSRSPDTPRLDGPVDQIVNANDFTIYDTTVTTTSGTVWKDGLGSLAGLTSGLRIEVKGTWNGTVMTAQEIGLED